MEWSLPPSGKLESLAQRLECVTRFLGEAVSWLSLLMVLVTFCIVVLRYAFDLGWIWLQESVTYMHAALFLVGAAYTLGQDSVNVLLHEGRNILVLKVLQGGGLRGHF